MEFIVKNLRESGPFCTFSERYKQKQFQFYLHLVNTTCVVVVLFLKISP